MNNPNVLPGPNILAEDIEREIKKLKRAINRKLDPEPDLAPLVDNFPGVDNVGLLDTITAPLVMAATNTAPLVMVEMASQKSRIHRNTSQMRALAARQREFNRLGYAHIKDFYAGNITAEDLHARLRDEIKGLHVSAAVTGRGFEWDEMTFSDWGRVGNECRKQYGFLEGFVRKLADGGKSEAQAYANWLKFSDAGRASFERTAAVRTGLPVDLLPAFPGDGSTECYTSCKCMWHITTLSAARGNWNVSWRMGKAEHCKTCRARARRLDGWGRLQIRQFRWVTPPPAIYRV